LIENHSQGIGDDAFIVGDEHSGPDSTVGGKSVHKTLAENKKARVCAASISPVAVKANLFPWKWDSRRDFARLQRAYSASQVTEVANRIPMGGLCRF
jgi:hypothetical protein